MAIAESKLSKTNQVTIPEEIREKLGIGPGSVVQWIEEGDGFIVRRAKTYTWEDIHRRLFKKPPKPITVEEMDEAIGSHLVEKFKNGRR